MAPPLLLHHNDDKDGSARYPEIHTTNITRVPHQHETGESQTHRKKIEIFSRVQSAVQTRPAGSTTRPPRSPRQRYDQHVRDTPQPDHSAWRDRQSVSEGGYTQPKPFVRVQGKPMIQWLIDRLQAQPQDTLVVIYNPAFLNMQSQMERLGEYLDSIERFKSVRFVKLPGPTRGAAETVGFGIRALSSEEAKNPCMLLDGDCFFTADVVSKYREVAAKGFGASVVFTDTQPKPIYSYVKVDDDQSMKINKIIEKVKISDLANTGCYCFRSGGSFASTLI